MRLPSTVPLVDARTCPSAPPLGKKDPNFRTKPQLALELIDAALAAGVPFRAVAADSADGRHLTFEAGLWAVGGGPAVRGQSRAVHRDVGHRQRSAHASGCGKAALLGRANRPW